jgi:hypothetical protein
MGRRLTDEERALRDLTEKDFQKQLLEMARMFGWRVAHFHDSRRQVKPGVFVGDKDAAGFPDLVLVRPPDILVLELKRELGKTTDAQDEWLAALLGCGIEARVVRPSDWNYLVDRLKPGRRQDR